MKIVKFVCVVCFSRIRWEDTGAEAELCGSYTLYAPPPPTSGAVLAGIMQILCHFDLTPEALNDAKTYQKYVEALKFAFAKRNNLGDWNDPEHRDKLEKVSCCG